MRFVNKKNTIEKYKISEKDTGSSNVQVALLTEKINYLAAHMKVHKKDNHSNRGLLLAVTSRKKHLEYIKRNDEGQYQTLIQQLGLRK